jgi:adenylate cyclase
VRVTFGEPHIEDFTGTTERLQPEEITSLLNEYLTEMSNIAAKYGGTLNKFIGDAIVIFFGDPETKGAAEDAKGWLAMAVHMQGRMAELNAQWRRRGIERSDLRTFRQAFDCRACLPKSKRQCRTGVFR